MIKKNTKLANIGGGIMALGIILTMALPQYPNLVLVSMLGWVVGIWNYVAAKARSPYWAIGSIFIPMLLLVILILEDKSGTAAS